MNFAGTAFVVGFLLSIPVGPVASLVIRRTLARGLGAGIAAGAGVAFADAGYGALGAAGATSPFAARLSSPSIAIGAALLLIVLGVAIIRAPLPSDLASAATVRVKAAGFAGTFAVAMLNPGAIAIVAAAFAAVRVPPPNAGGYVIALAALFAGAMLWWTLLAGLLVRARERLGVRALRVLNVATGSVAIVAGAAAAVSAATKLHR